MKRHVSARIETKKIANISILIVGLRLEFDKKKWESEAVLRAQIVLELQFAGLKRGYS